MGEDDIWYRCRSTATFEARWLSVAGIDAACTSAAVVENANTKTPYFIHLRSGRPFGFAGIWSAYRTPVGQRVGACAILICVPNELMAPIHNRMPVILPKAARDRWLARSADAGDLQVLLTSFPAEEMEAYPVSTVVNSPRNDTPGCIARLAAGDLQ